ncbi:hypothetical protein D3C87_1818310 [compost metagenome]
MDFVRRHTETAGLVLLKHFDEHGDLVGDQTLAEDEGVALAGAQLMHQLGQKGQV